MIIQWRRQAVTDIQHIQAASPPAILFISPESLYLFAAWRQAGMAKAAAQKVVKKEAGRKINDVTWQKQKQKGVAAGVTAAISMPPYLLSLVVPACYTITVTREAVDI